MFVRNAGGRTLALMLSATALVTLPSIGHAHPSNAPQNCAVCHGNALTNGTPRTPLSANSLYLDTGLNIPGDAVYTVFMLADVSAPVHLQGSAALLRW